MTFTHQTSEQTIPFTQHFDAWLPSIERPVRITSIYDAQVFTRRWVIRDKDPVLKVLLRKLEKANSAALIEEAMGSFKQAQAARALLPKPMSNSMPEAAVAGPDLVSKF
jgi:hypothetical protein